jgi:hypothetical protein
MLFVGCLLALVENVIRYAAKKNLNLRFFAAHEFSSFQKTGRADESDFLYYQSCSHSASHAKGCETSPYVFAFFHFVKKRCKNTRP